MFDPRMAIIFGFTIAAVLVVSIEVGRSIYEGTR